MISASLHPEPVRAACKPRGRFAFGLTPRTIWLLVAGLALALPGFFSARLGYGMLVWDALVLLAVLWDGMRLPAPQSITVERSWSNAPSLSSPTEIEIAVEQNGGTILECRIVDDLPEALVAVPSTWSLRVYPRVRAALRYTIDPRAARRRHYRCRCTCVTIRCSASSINGPWRRSSRPCASIPRSGKVRTRKSFSRAAAKSISQLRQVRERGLGRDFESLREYLEGDDLRDICWTATARRGQLITRRYQTERSQAVWIVLDAGRLLQGRILRDTDDEDRRGYSKLDYACSTAVALAQLALYSGDRVGLLVYGQHVQQRVLPGRGPAHLRQIVEALSQARAEPSEADHLRATATLNRWQPRRALILWITDLAETAMRPEVIDGAMQLLQRHVLLFVAMAQPDVEAIAKGRPKECRTDVPRFGGAGTGDAPRAAPCAAARSGRAHPRSRSRSTDFGGTQPIFKGERAGDGLRTTCCTVHIVRNIQTLSS